MWWEIAIAVLCSLFLREVLNWWFNPLRKIPGPPGLPIIGNFLDFYRNPDLPALLLQWTKTYGNVFKYERPMVGSVVYLVDAEYAKQVLVTNNKKYCRSELVKTLWPSLGSGLVTSNGKLHAMQRKHLNPEFSLASIKKYLPIFNNKAKELIKFWNCEIMLNNEKPIESEVSRKFCHLTLDVIGLCSFGYSFNCTTGEHHEESLAAEKILSMKFDFLQISIEEKFPFLKMFNSKARQELEKAERVFYGVINEVIRLRREELKADKKKAMERNDLMQTLLSMYQNENEQKASEDIFSQVLTFMIAGHDTSSTAMTWTILLFAKYPNIQEKAQKEISDAIGDSGEIRWEDLEHLKYLDNCIKEAMRLYPPGSSVSRVSIEEDKIGPYVLPAGTNVNIGVASLQQSEKLWKDPQEFNPDRFQSSNDPSQNDKQSLLPYSFLPFSRGPRMCIGYRFAQVEIKVVLALLLNSFSFKLGKGQPDKFEARELLTLKPFPSPIIEINTK